MCMFPFIHSLLSVLYLKEKNNLKPGDLIEIFRGLYKHWAVYVGDGYVVHLVGAGSNFSSSGSLSKGSSSRGNKSSDGVVKKEKLEDVVGFSHWQINNLLDHKYKPRPADDIVKNALSLVNTKQKYNLLMYNCEHFSTEMRYGKAESRQIQEAVKGEGIVGAAAKGAAVGAIAGAFGGPVGALAGGAVGGAVGAAGAALQDLTKATTRRAFRLLDGLNH